MNYSIKPKDNINISFVTKELISLVLKMTGEEKFLLLKNQTGQQQTFSTFFNPKTITKQLIEMIMNMSLQERCKLLGEYKTAKGMSRRQSTRKDFINPIYFAVKGKLRKDFTRDISKTGLFIETPKSSQATLKNGDPITMNFDHPQLDQPIKITGKIVRVASNGIGVTFDGYL